ncbi:MAG: carbamoyltransferase N-terminal domain-containing protein, partial [Clostridia bacterium]|nr:carbamoyltransferase N-terminal domain-containing protein [Clostridia bacterium]
GLGYPGGPKVSAFAEKGKACIPFPRPIHGLDFSFSGVKTAVINYVHTAEQKGEKICREDIAASFQKAVVDVLVHVTLQAARERGIRKIALAGGVAANTCLRKEMQKAAKLQNAEVFMPSGQLCTDNGAMISCAGYYAYIAGERADLSQNAFPSL